MLFQGERSYLENNQWEKIDFKRVTIIPTVDLQKGVHNKFPDLMLNIHME